MRSSTWAGWPGGSYPRSSRPAKTVYGLFCRWAAADAWARIHRFAMQTLGWTAPKLRSPAAADRWTWLVLASHTQLRLARRLTHELRRPWERPLPVERLTPARLRRGFRYLRARTPSPASAPKPAHPGPGRPPAAEIRHRAPRYDVGRRHQSRSHQQ